SGSLRVAQGQVQAGLTYTVAAAALPSVDDLRSITEPVPAAMARFTEVPPPPPAVADLLARAPKSSKWDEFDFLRTWVLSNVTATGTGTPKSVPPERVQDMLAGSKEGSPFEIVAVQALLARWAGIPARIGYGFDGGDLHDQKLEVRPRNGASFPEVFFSQYGWLPVIGTPAKAKPTVGADADTQRQDPTIAPSDDIQVGLFVPVLVPPKSPLPSRCSCSTCSGPACGRPGSGAGAGPRPGPPAPGPASPWPTPSGATSAPTTAIATTPTRRSCTSTASSTTPSTPSWPGSSPAACGATCRSRSRPSWRR